MARTIDQDVLTVLQHVEYDGPALRLTGQLDRPLYLKTNKVIEGLGGKWNKKAKAHLFDGDAAEICGDAITTGQYVDEKQQFQFFETPDELAGELARRLPHCDKMQALEPSAGRGKLVAALNRECLADVVCVEINGRHHEALSEYGGPVHIADFLTLTPEMVEGPFDAVLMNPPFTRSQDIAHVRHAYEFLKPGGTLIGIMSAGFTFRMDRKATEFREWLSGCGSYEQLPPQSFKSSGTLVNSVVVTARK